MFSRVVMGARFVLSIAPAATLFAFMVGVTLGLPAGYFGKRLDTILSFIANMVLAFPVILLFYLLVTPEIRVTGIPTIMAAVLFLFPIAFLMMLFQSRYYTEPAKRNLYCGITLIICLWAYSGLAFNADPLDVFYMDPNLLNVFVSVVFVNSPTVFRIVRGITLDIQTRDYVAAAQTRGEGHGISCFGKFCPMPEARRLSIFVCVLAIRPFCWVRWAFLVLASAQKARIGVLPLMMGASCYRFIRIRPCRQRLALMSLVLGLNLLADGLREESLKD